MGGLGSLSMRMMFESWGKAFWSIVTDRVILRACFLGCLIDCWSACVGTFSLIARVRRLHEIPDYDDDDATLLTVYKILVMNDEACPSLRDLHATPDLTIQHSMQTMGPTQAHHCIPKITTCQAFTAERRTVFQVFVQLLRT